METGPTLSSKVLLVAMLDRTQPYYLDPPQKTAHRPRPCLLSIAERQRRLACSLPTQTLDIMVARWDSQTGRKVRIPRLGLRATSFSILPPSLLQRREHRQPQKCLLKRKRRCRHRHKIRRPLICRNDMPAMGQPCPAMLARTIHEQVLRLWATEICSLRPHHNRSTITSISRRVLRPPDSPRAA